MTAAVRTPINRKRVRDHFTYAFWKYALLVIIGVFGWNLIYSVTAYRPPKEKKVDVYLVTSAVESEATERLAALAAPAFPDMEALNFMSIAMGTTDDYYANIQLTTYIGAQEGDIYLMPWDRFQTFAQSGLFISLDEWIADGSIDLRGIDPGQGRLTVTDDGVEASEAASSHIYGIPAETLYDMLDQGVDNRGLWIGVTAYSGNLPNAVKMADWLIARFQAEKPQWLVDYEAAQPAPATDDGTLPSY
ncbi:MAG: hypothetical protein LBS11_01305 [Oscillospiraceae bacterium]|jgi:hypothetical protein|nr:hypothetical protein [Oscillospiraceae bacterium]